MRQSQGTIIMEYFDDVLDRTTGELKTISKGDWITVTELGTLYRVGRREVRTVLRHMGVLVTEGAARHQRHRLAAWVVQREWGKRIEKKGRVPFDVLGPDVRAWIGERWEQTKDDIASEATAPSLLARAALEDFKATRDRKDLPVQAAVSWLADHFPTLTQTEIAMVLDVTQQLVAKYLAARAALLREAKRLAAMDLDERQKERSDLHRVKLCRSLIPDGFSEKE